MAMYKLVAADITVLSGAEVAGHNWFGGALSVLVVIAIIWFTIRIWESDTVKFIRKQCGCTPPEFTPKDDGDK